MASRETMSGFRIISAIVNKDIISANIHKYVHSANWLSAIYLGGVNFSALYIYVGS